MKNILLNSKFWFIGNIKKYFPFLSNYIRSTTSIITIDYKAQTVTKETIRYLHLNIVENEIKWLTILNDFIHTPNIISYDKNKLILSYAGKPLNYKNLPDDWQNQLNIILDKLKNINCSHNDIKPTDLLIFNNKIMLIDFQWATKINDPIPEDWPSCIGGLYKNKDNFDDSYSIYKSINSILKSKT